MSAGSGAVANIVGADIAIVGTAGAVRGIAVIGGFVTDVVADRPAAAGVADMGGTGAAGTGIGAVTV